MLKFFSRLRLAYSYGPELEQVVKNLRKEKEREEEARTQHHLQLCKHHQQRSPGTEYAPHNCDYCGALAQLDQQTRTVVQEIERKAKIALQQQREP